MFISATETLIRGGGGFYAWQLEQVMNGAARQSKSFLALRLWQLVICFGSKEANRRLDQRCHAQLCLSCYRCDARQRFEVQASWSPPSLRAILQFLLRALMYITTLSFPGQGPSIKRFPGNFKKLCHCDSALFTPPTPMCATFTVWVKFFEPRKLFFPFQINLLTGSRATLWLASLIRDHRSVMRFVWCSAAKQSAFSSSCKKPVVTVLSSCQSNLADHCEIAVGSIHYGMFGCTTTEGGLCCFGLKK